jgi:hypothetical protein
MNTDKNNPCYLCNLWLKLTVVADCLNWTTGQRLFTLRPLLIRLGLFVDKRIIVCIAAREVVRRGVATDIAVDARGVHVKRTADVLFNFVVLIRHAGLCDQGCVISSGITIASNCSPVK